MELTINERKSMSSKSNPESSLPPGFRFHPTDEELILHYLRNKVTTTMYPVSIIAEVDIYKFDPWDLPEKAVFGEKEWYFFSHRDRKYPNGARPNRAAVSGYWKATGTDKMIVRGGTIDEEMMKIGVKKALVFYTGKPPKGVKTNWIMHEYRLSENPNNNNNIKPINPKHSTRLEDWVLCRIYKKSNNLPSMTTTEKEEEYEPLIQDDLQPAFPSLLPNQYNLKPQKSSSFSDLLRVMDYSILTSLMSDGNQSDSNGWNNQNQSIFNNNINNSLPRLDYSVSPVIENQLKRQHSSMDEGVGVGLLHPSKKLNNSYNFTNGNNQLDAHQYQLTNQPILNQHLQFSSHLQFQR